MDLPRRLLPPSLPSQTSKTTSRPPPPCHPCAKSNHVPPPPLNPHSMIPTTPFPSPAQTSPAKDGVLSEGDYWVKPDLQTLIHSGHDQLLAFDGLVSHFPPASTTRNYLHSH